MADREVEQGGVLSATDRLHKEAQIVLERPTAKTQLLARILASPDNRYQGICEHLTRLECAQAHQSEASSSKELHDASGSDMRDDGACSQIHYEAVMYPQTEPSLGHCSYLNTCHRTASCKYLHFRLDRSPAQPDYVWKAPYLEDSPDAEPMLHPRRALARYGLHEWMRDDGSGADGIPVSVLTSRSRSVSNDVPRSLRLGKKSAPLPAQWIDGDLKYMDYSVLGKFDVILADPPWDIHMSLPYGTMTDDEMRAMPIPELQDEGLIFLWTTGRAMELGRELLGIWGYTRIDELIWVKVGQTQRLIRTGRTGHWLNHTKEHCLVGAKVGSMPLPSSPLPGLSTAYVASLDAGVPAPIPSWVHRGVAADVIVSEVRDTSRKPDELYSLIERMCPGGRKVELFGRRHNARPGWLTIGNQLKGDNVHDQQLHERLTRWRQESGITAGQ